MLIGCKDVHEAAREVMEKIEGLARYPIISCYMTCKGISPSGNIYVPNIHQAGTWRDGERVREALAEAAPCIFRRSEELRALADDISSHAYMPPSALRDHLLRSWKSGGVTIQGVELCDRGSWPVKESLIDYKKYFHDLYLTGEAWPTTAGRASIRVYDIRLEDSIIHLVSEEMVKAASAAIPDKSIVSGLMECIPYHSITISFDHNTWHGKGPRMNYAVMSIDFISGSPEVHGSSFWDIPISERDNIVKISANYVIGADKFMKEDI